MKEKKQSEKIHTEEISSAPCVPSILNDRSNSCKYISSDINLSTFTVIIIIIIIIITIDKVTS